MLRLSSTLLLFLFLDCTLAQVDNFYTIASSWSMWSAWSACAPGGVMIRVRACSTVRGFKCVGRNKEFKSCDLGPQNNLDFDHVDEDRQMALRQLYQDYDLRADNAEVPRKHVTRPVERTRKPIMPTGNEDLIVAPPGSRVAPVPVADGDTQFRGEWRTSSEAITHPPHFSIHTTKPTQFVQHTTTEAILPPSPISREQSLESTEEPHQPTIPTTSSVQRSKSVESGQVDSETEQVKNVANNYVIPKQRYRAKYVKQAATVTTPMTTTTAKDDGGEVWEEDDEEEPLPAVVDPVTQQTSTVTTVTTTEATTTTTELMTTTTEEPTTTEMETEATTTETTTQERVIELTTPSSFAISAEEITTTEKVFVVQPKRTGYSRRMKKPNTRPRQLLPTIFQVPQAVKPTRLAFVPPAAPSTPPRLIPGKIHHSGEVSILEVSPEVKPIRRRKPKHRKHKTTTTAPDDLLTGDTARALTWIIANMTSSVNDDPMPVMDTVQLEKVLRKEAKEASTNPPGIRWSHWSLWSECSCGVQRRKRICLPSSREDSCPPPEHEERKCVSDACH